MSLIEYEYSNMDSIEVEEDKVFEVASKKRIKKTSHPKVSKRLKMSDDDDDVDGGTANKKVVILELKCPQRECNLTLESLDQLYQHQETVHGVLAFPCLVGGCSEQFSARYKIGHHYSTVHPQHTDWTCPQCNAKSMSAILLRRHIRDRHQFGQFHCAHLVCTFEADVRSKVRNHRNLAHGHFVCSIDGCSKAFARKSWLKQHKQAVHL